MFNPVEFSLKIQQAAMESAAASARMMATNYLRFVEQQSHLLQHTFAYRRDEDTPNASTQKKSKSPLARKARSKKSRGAKSPCSGADLHDHYGKRAHDVDVDHI